MKKFICKILGIKLANLNKGRKTKITKTTSVKSYKDSCMMWVEFSSWDIDKIIPLGSGYNAKQIKNYNLEVIKHSLN